MIRLPSRPGQSNTAVLTTLGVLIGLVVAGLIFVPMVLRLYGSQSQSSSSSSAASSAQQQTSSVRTSDQQAALNACIDLATETHNQLWAQRCTQESAILKRAYNACIANGQDQSYCQTQFGAYASMGSSCTLPVAMQNELNTRYAAAKTLCQNRTF